MIGAADTERSIIATKSLVARWVGIVSAAWRVSSVSSISGSADGSGTNAYRHSTAYGCTTINATVIDACAMNAAVISASTTSICESVR